MVDRGVVLRAPLLDKADHQAAVNNTLIKEVMKLLYVGIDWADTQHQVSVIDSQGLEKANFTISHNRAGLECLKEKLLQIAGNPHSVACII